MNELMTPSLLWADFDETFDGKIEVVKTEGIFRRLTVTAFSASDGDVVIETDVYSPEYERGNVIVLIGDYAKKAQQDVVDALCGKGFCVVVPDYSGVFEDSLTSFPESLSYGRYFDGNEHLTKVCPTAKETCFYLYTKIIRKIISAINGVLPKGDVVIMGLRRGTEIALQTVGTDSRPIGLALIAGAGYREYFDYPRYGSDKVLSVEGDLMQWITSVSGTAYAKRVKVPAIIAIASNGTESDIDRAPALMSLMQAETSLCVSAGYRDNIDKKTFDTVIKWLEGIFLLSVPPKKPSLTVNINSEGELYGEVKADDSVKIKEVRVRYSYGDNNHSTRFWRESSGDFIGDGGYIARLKAGVGSEMLFAYAETEYVNGYISDGGVVYVDLRDKKIKTSKSVTNPIIFQHPDENGFVEISDDTVIMKSSLREGVLPIGLKGLCCDKGGMVSYSIGNKTGFDETRLLQIDTYSSEKTYVLRVSVVDGNNVEYNASKEIESTETFFSLLLTPNAFKDGNMQPLESWESVKSLTVLTSGVIVGKIMFI